MDDKWGERWRDDDRYRRRDDRDWERDRFRDRDREAGSPGQLYGQRDYDERYGRERRDFGPGPDREYGYGRGGSDFDRERRFGSERGVGRDQGYSRDRGWRPDDHPGYARNEYRPRERGVLERGRDEVSSWFGDEEAMRRRRQDELRERERHPERWRERDDLGRREQQRAEWRSQERGRDLSRDREDWARREDRRWEDERWRHDAADRWERDWRGSNRDW